MKLRVYVTVAALMTILASCRKQSIADAMLNGPGSGGRAVTATLRYEINGKLVNVTVKDANRQPPSRPTLVCEKSNVYILSGVIGAVEDFVFTFYTDSLKPGNYRYAGNMGTWYVTTFEGRPQYVYNPADYMNVNVTTVKDGYISGNFSGQLTPAITAGTVNNIYGTPGSVLIKNGSFTNVPIVY